MGVQLLNYCHRFALKLDLKSEFRLFPKRKQYCPVSPEGAGQRDGAIRTLVAVLHPGPNRLPHRVDLPRSQGSALALGARPRPPLRLPRSPRGPHLPLDRDRGRGAGLGSRGEPPGGGPLHSGPAVAGTLGPQIEGVQRSGQEGSLSAEDPERTPADEARTWVRAPPPTDTHRARRRLHGRPLALHSWAGPHSGPRVIKKTTRHAHPHTTVCFTDSPERLARTRTNKL